MAETLANTKHHGLHLVPSIHATAALLAGLLSQRITFQDQGQITAIVTLWVGVDLALGAYYRGWCQWAQGRVQKDRGFPLNDILALIASAAMLLAIAWLFEVPLRYLAGVSLALGPCIAVYAVHRPRGSIALAAGIQALVAWMAGSLYHGGDPSPLWGIGLLGALGVLARITHLARPTHATLAIVRFCWIVSAALLIWARQPLLGALIALTALGDDLTMSQWHVKPVRGYALGMWNWAGTWLLIALASTQWAA